MEAFIRSLDRGETVIQQKYFSQLKDLYEVLGITEKDGVGFPSIYGAQRTPAEEEHSETPQEMKTEERPDQREPEGSDQVDDPAQERVDEGNLYKEVELATCLGPTPINFLQLEHVLPIP